MVSHTRPEAVDAANAIKSQFEKFQSNFVRLTCSATDHFENSTSAQTHLVAVKRLELYEKTIATTLSQMAIVLEGSLTNTKLWYEIREHYLQLIEIRYDRELAQTFFNSVVRKFFLQTGIDEGLEFVDADFDFQERTTEQNTFWTFEFKQNTSSILREMIDLYQFKLPCEISSWQQSSIEKQIENIIEKHGSIGAPAQIEMLNSPFYRDGGAYLIGRLRQGSNIYVPFILSLRNRNRQIQIDAIILNENLASILFSFAHSYFFVNIPHYRHLIKFLKSFLPRKRIDELYASIGHHKHAKTELLRILRWHLARSKDQFVRAPGQPGMVMVVFTLPSFDLVFKLIRDKFSPPKRGTHAKVSEKYELVFKHDRVGRLVDAQEFRNLEFRRDKFSPKLLEHLLELAPSIVKVKNNVVHLIHVYTERRVTPLDIYVKTQPFDKVRAAILDYGAAIKELAAANIFPGDLFLKNFGVTRHGRVVFYDYDELCLITECCFRRIPPPRYDFEELEPEPWFRVQENDVFPEEFQSFIGIPLGHREIFQSTHGDLFTAEFWKNLKEAHEEGKHFEIFPYPNASKL